MSYPLWATPERRACLVQLFLKYGNLCLEGHTGCLDPTHYRHLKPKAWVVGKPVKLPVEDKETGLAKPGVYLETYRLERKVEYIPEWVGSLYWLKEDDLIEVWKADDRAERSYLHRLEQRRMHRAPQIRRRGKFDSIRREQYLAERPIFRLLGIGVNAFTQHRVAKVEIPELDKVIWVDISKVKLSKNKLHKLTRHARNSRGVPPEIYNEVARVAGRYLGR